MKTSNLLSFTRTQFAYCLTMLYFIVFFLNTVKAQPQLSYTPFIQNLNLPLEIKNAGDGSGRLFIVQQDGLIKIYKNNQLLPKPFLDISQIISIAYLKGLLSIVFPPNYKQSQVFFILYVDKNNNSVLARFKTSNTNADSAIFNSQRILITFPRVVLGQLQFGSDGYLYVSACDGSFYSNTTKFAQDGQSLLGKILRLNVNNNTAPYYTIPPDNPFVNDTTIRDEIWALGLRNAWRWSFDKTNGRLYLPDVGGDNREEVNIRRQGQQSGINYGWPCYEGNDAFIITGCRNINQYVFPVFTYPHNDTTGGYAIIGGYVYRGTAYPSLKGYYICSDHLSNNAWKIKLNSTGTFDAFIQKGIPNLIAGYGEGEDGELYAASLEGIVYRVGTTPTIAESSNGIQKNVTPVNAYSRR